MIAHAFALYVAVSVGANVSGGHVKPAVTPYYDEYARKLQNIIRGLPTVKYMSLSSQTMEVLESQLRH